MGRFRDGRVNVEREDRRRALLLPVDCFVLLERQHDVIADWQLRAAGLTSGYVQGLIDGGMLRALPGRNLTTRRARLDVPARRWSALLSAGGPGARLAGASALAVWRVREREPDPIHVLVEGSAPRPCPGVRFLRTKHLPPTDLRVVDGFPTTTVARALVDAASRSTVEELSQDLDRAIMLGRFDEQALTAARQARRGLHGLPRIHDALASLDEHSGRFLSDFERRTVRLIQQSPVLGPVVVNVIAKGFRPDIRFVGTPVIVECDGRDYHRSLAQIAADEERERQLIAMGFVILRLRWAAVRYEPERTLARIERFVQEQPRIAGA